MFVWQTAKNSTTYKTYAEDKLKCTAKQNKDPKVAEVVVNKTDSVVLLSNVIYYERIEIAQITSSDVTDIKNTLFNISQKVPNRKLNIINREWESLVKFIDMD